MRATFPRPLPEAAGAGAAAPLLLLPVAPARLSPSSPKLSSPAEELGGPAPLLRLPFAVTVAGGPIELLSLISYPRDISMSASGYVIVSPPAEWS